MISQYFKTPDFWYNTRSPLSFMLRTLLLPASWIYHLGTWINKTFHKKYVKQYRSTLPIICVGNLVAGGAGKTPTVMALAKYFKEAELNVAFILRGYGTNIEEPIKVDNKKHTHLDVGDEAMMLSYYGETFVCNNRVKAIKLAEESDADLIIADDGLQNYTFMKDIKILVLNGTDGFGNEKLIPAGPLRENRKSLLPEIDMTIIIGEDKRGLKKQFTCPVITAKTVVPKNCASRAVINKFGQKPIVAFAGIGRPQKFFNTLKKDLNYNVIKTKAYPDHFPYDDKALDELKHLSLIHQAILITTFKDYFRLPKDFKMNVVPVTIDLVFDNQSKMKKVLNRILV